MKKFKYLLQLILLFYSYTKSNSSCDKRLSNCFKNEIKNTVCVILKII